MVPIEKPLRREEEEIIPDLPGEEPIVWPEEEPVREPVEEPVEEPVHVPG